MSSTKTSELVERFALRTLGQTLRGDSAATSVEPSEPSQATTPTQTVSETLLRTMGGLVAAAALKHGAEARLFALVDALEPMRIEELFPVVRWLEDNGFATVAERPRNGNWLVQLTDKGKQFVAAR